MPEDCISITEKTFDLSLDDTQIDSSEEEEENQTHEGLSQPPSMILFNDSSRNIQKRSTKAACDTAGGIGMGRSDNGKDSVRVERSGAQKSASNQGENSNRLETNDDYLYKSLATLQRISGTDIKIRSFDRYNGDELQIPKLIYELSENSALKVLFYEKNYKFLENLYESLQRNYDQLKSDHDEISAENEELKKALKEREVKKDVVDVVERQEKEIRGYKRFIKEMMER